MGKRRQSRAIETGSSPAENGPQTLPSLTNSHNMADRCVRRHSPHHPPAGNRRWNSYICEWPDNPSIPNRPQSLPVVISRGPSLTVARDPRHHSRGVCNATASIDSGWFYGFNRRRSPPGSACPGVLLPSAGSGLPTRLSHGSASSCHPANTRSTPAASGTDTAAVRPGTATFRPGAATAINAQRAVASDDATSSAASDGDADVQPNIHGRSVWRRSRCAHNGGDVSRRDSSQHDR